jgi:hypothetical protein
MITILVDHNHNIEGQAALLWSTLTTAGWTDLLTVRFVTFVQVGLSVASTDRVVWQFAQDHEMLLLTANHNMDDPDSLEQTIRDANQPTSFPVLTIGKIDRMIDAHYRDQCATRLAEIVVDLEDYRGVGRLFIP